MNVMINLKNPKNQPTLKYITRRLKYHGLVPVFLDEWRRRKHKKRKHTETVYVGYAKDVLEDISCLAMYQKTIYDIGDPSMWRERLGNNLLKTTTKTRSHEEIN